MDGNGRWAQKRSRPRVWGHVRGSHVVSEIVRRSSDCGIKTLTLYAFSSENWSRPIHEVRILFRLLKKFIILKGNEIHEENLCFKVVGDRKTIPNEVMALVLDLEEKTKHNQGMKLYFAFAYGGRQEIISSINEHVEKFPGKKMSEFELEKNLQLKESNIDLLIRTGGDYRISNFLLWQCAYAELFFTKTLWPEFTANEFESILIEVSGRHRRFGSIEFNNYYESQKTAQLNQEKILYSEKI